MSDKSIIQVPAIFTGFSSRADGGATMRFATNELGDVDFSLLKQFHNSFGYLLFSKNELTDADIPKGQAEDSAKTPSQRLRAVLFVYWKQLGETGDFEDFYRTQMDRFINAVKTKLD